MRQLSLCPTLFLNPRKRNKSKPFSANLNYRLKEILDRSFVFSNLPKQEQSIIIDAMEEKSFGAGATVIKQDDAGDVLYVVEDG